MRLYIFLSALLCSFGLQATAQCNLQPVPLQQRVQASDLIIEGTVTGTWSRWDDLHHNIYTINAVEILSTLKGQTSDTIVYIVTPGGRVDMDLEITTHAVELNRGKTGIFTLIPNNKPITGDYPLYEVYAATQGFLQYNRQEHSVRGIFDAYTSPEVLYTAIGGLTGTPLQRRKVLDWNSVNDLHYSLQDVLESVNENHLQGDTLYSEQLSYAIAAGATISSFSPTTVQSGRGVLLTINGSGFGASQGSSVVQFLNADAGGASYTSPAATQYVSWSDTQIQVYVPTAAGTGIIRVTDGINTATSAGILTVEYAILNVNYSGSYYRPNLVNDNTTGGYTFQMNTAFDANVPARTDFQNVIYQWRCATGVNWIFGSTTAVTQSASDNINIVRFDSGSELSAGVLGVCASRYSGCTDGVNFYWYVSELDVTIDDGTNFFYGNVGTPSGAQADFYSVMLHELGHGHQLGHVIDGTKVMHYSISNGEQKRTLAATEIAGASYELAQSVIGGTCTATAHIDYSCNPSVTLTTGAASVSESGNTTVTATLSKPAFADVTVTLGLSGTATAATDYTLATSILIPSGSTSASVTLTAINDLTDEPDETAIINITAVSGGTESGTQQQTITIIDDDNPPTVTLSTGTATISETGGSTTVTATLSNPSSQNVTVTLGLSGTATTATDYTLGTNITIPAGSTTASITLAATGDLTDETNETVIIDIAAVTNGAENGTQQQTVTITDDDNPPTVTLSTGTATISETGGSTTVTATLSAASMQTVTVTLGLTGTATITTDYTLGTTITFPAGSTNAAIALTAVGDPMDEPNETVMIDITGVTNATENGTQQQTVTITDDDNPPAVTLSTGTATISETGGSTTVTATLSAASSQAVTVGLGLSGTATITTDYTLGTTITIPAGSTNASITLSAVSDPTDEAGETAVIDITGVTNGSENGTQQQTVTITDDDNPPTVTLSTGTATISETGGSTTVTATLSSASSFVVSVTLSLSGTAVAGTDYTLSTTISIPAGSTGASLTLASIGDAVDETDETVVVDVLSVANGSENGVQQQTVTITDDDLPPSVSLSAGNMMIFETGGTTAVTATLSAVSSQAVTVTLSLAGSATTATDYTLGTTITIPAGNISASITLASVSDATDEPDETVVIGIQSIINATEAFPGATVPVIIADDDNAPDVTLSVAAATVQESAGNTTVTATLSAASAQTVTVTIVTGGTAGASDYVLSGTISIPAGSTSAAITLTAQDDAIDEADETVVIDIASVTNATESGTQQQTVTIIDNDLPPSVTLSAGSASIPENGGSTTITATLSALSTQNVDLSFGYGGTATNGVDYTGTATLTIPAGSLSGSITLTTIDDAAGEGDEQIAITLASVSNASDNGTSATVTITDNEAPEIALSSGANGQTYDFGSVTAGTTATATFTISNTGANPLVLTDASLVVLSGPNAGSFNLETSGLAASIAPGASSDFSVTVTAGCQAAPLTAMLTIPNNDSDEGSFIILLSATPQDTEVPVPNVANLPALTGSCSATAAPVSATDNCSGSVSGTTSDPLSYTVPGNYTIHWTFTDAAGNTSTQDQQVTVTGDVTAPEITCPTNISSTVPQVSYTLPTATDDCSVPTVALVSGPASGSTFPEGTTTVTYSATDAVGNTTSCSFTVTVSTSGLEEGQSIALQLFPNPASDAVTVVSEHIFEQVLIHDSRGALVTTLRMTETSVVVPVDGFEPGIYYMTFGSERATIVRKLEVMR